MLLSQPGGRRHPSLLGSSVQNYFPVQRCPEGKGKGQKPVLGAFHESQAGRTQQNPESSALGWAQMEHTALLGAVPSGCSQESLRCFFCCWYSVIFCWKYAVGTERWFVVSKQCQSCDICACSSWMELKGGAWGWMAHTGLQKATSKGGPGEKGLWGSSTQHHFPPE